MAVCWAETQKDTFSIFVSFFNSACDFSRVVDEFNQCRIRCSEVIGERLKVELSVSYFVGVILPLFRELANKERELNYGAI